MPDAAAHSPGHVSPDSFGLIAFAEFQQRVERRTGIHLGEYKADQMCRRIGSLAQKSGCASFAEYAALLERDPARLAEFRDRMTINVTELLRNPNYFAELAAVILPDLLARRQGAALSIWSAGCSYGAEAYTLAMLLHEVSPALPHHVLGTDIDPIMLARAARPCFTVTDAVNLSPDRRQAHFDGIDGGLRPKPHLQAHVRFSPHDLLGGYYPHAEYDLILCRNVIIYFTDEAKDRIAHGFLRALRPGGVLFVGGTERLSDHRALGFDLLRPFFYRKPLA